MNARVVNAFEGVVEALDIVVNGRQEEILTGKKLTNFGPPIGKKLHGISKRKRRTMRGLKIRETI